jgi:ankyrin repeat protein
MLIESGADLHLASNDGWLPLHWAAALGREEIAEYFIQNGASINELNKLGSSATDLAVYRKKDNLAIRLKQLGGKCFTQK